MIKYFSLFSGIGGFELGIQKADERIQGSLGAKPADTKPGQTVPEIFERGKRTAFEKRHRVLPRHNRRIGSVCVGYSEIDKYAIQIYEKHFPSHKNYGDITNIKASELPDFDFLVGGFPCQAFSIAGQRRGFSDDRGAVFFVIARIIKVKKPKLFLLENVKGLLSHDNGRTFKTIIRSLAKLGYDIEWQVFNSKNFGVPQNRERVFIVGHLRGKGGRKIFPLATAGQETDKESTAGRNRLECIYDGDFQSHRVYAKSGLSPTIPTSGGGHHIPFIAPTLDANYYKGININPGHASSKRGIQINGRIRRLTPTECERLQGFPDGWTAEGTQGEISDTQRYKTLGNAVTVNVITAIMNLLNINNNKNYVKEKTISTRRRCNSQNKKHKNYNHKANKKR